MEVIKMESTVKKAKTLFPQTQFPIHHIFMEVLYRYCSTEGGYIIRSDMENLSQAMGIEFVRLFDLINKRDNHEFFNLCLKLKIVAKKTKALTKQEFSLNTELSEISAAISPYILAFKHEEQEIKREEERIKALNHEKRALKQEEQRAKEKSHYLKHFCDFPEFGIHKIKKASFAAKTLIRLQKKEATEPDFLWLREKGFDTEETAQAFLDFFFERACTRLQYWQKTNKPWNLVNAIADFRRSESSEHVLEIIQSNYPFKFTKGNKQLNSALLTTSGGVYRDLGHYDESLKLGKEAIELTPDDFRPCTLVGASNMLLGNINEGHLWYEKAIERGFKTQSYENELRSIYMRSNNQIKEELQTSLLAKGFNYPWIKG